MFVMMQSLANPQGRQEALLSSCVVSSRFFNGRPEGLSLQDSSYGVWTLFSPLTFAIKTWSLDFRFRTLGILHRHATSMLYRRAAGCSMRGAPNIGVARVSEFGFRRFSIVQE